MPQTQLTETDILALRVIDLAKSLILADNHFLSGAIGRLRAAPSYIDAPFATDGFVLAFDGGRVIEAFKRTGSAPKHDLLHSLMHCVFLHPYVGAAVDRPLWDLASDIAAEQAVLKLCGQRPGRRGLKIAQALSTIELQTGASLSAEKVYGRLRAGMWTDHLAEWHHLFHSDAHGIWYVPLGSGDAGDSESAGATAPDRPSPANHDANNSPECENTAESSQSVDNQSEQGHEAGRNANANTSDNATQNSASKVDAQANAQASNAAHNMHHSSDHNEVPHSGAMHAAATPLQGEGAGSQSKPFTQSAAGRGLRELQRPNLQQQKEEWRHVATSLAINLQTLSAKQGEKLGELVSELEAACAERVDYASFLSHFATSGEVMRLSDEDFDLIFYTYGMHLYDDLPLIEPLESRIEKRIREFVIVIDTSGSVYGDAVQRFVDATFQILKTTESFFSRVRVRILQCDTCVRSDDVINSLDELREWGKTMTVRGCGGTDFRPAFAYVDALVEAGEFEDLGGLVYFTDGWGTYPEHMPSYQTAFVFYDENIRPDNAPPWAIQVTLDNESIQNASAAWHFV